MKGKIRVPRRNLACPKCGDPFEDIGKKGYVCPNCLTVPDRYYLDIHFRGKRVRVFCDKQGIPLDSFERAFNLLAHVNYEIENYLFDPRKYIRSELVESFFKRRFEVWLEGRKDEIGKGNFAPASYKKYKTVGKNFYIPFFKDEDVREIRSNRIEEFYRWLPAKSSKYIKDILGVLESFFSDMFTLEYIEKKPVFPNVRVDEKLRGWVRRDGQNNVLGFIAAEDKDIFEFLTRQGLRVGEARALKVKDFDDGFYSLVVRRGFSNNVLVERTKTRKDDRVKLNPELVPMMKRLCSKRFPEEFVFVNPRTGRPYYDKTLNRIWNKACEAAGIEIELYCGTRHSLTSQGSVAGVPSQVLSGMLRHRDQRSLARYDVSGLAGQEMAFALINKANKKEKRHRSVSKLGYLKK